MEKVVSLSLCSYPGASAPRSCNPHSSLASTVSHMCTRDETRLGATAVGQTERLQVLGVTTGLPLRAASE